MAKTTVSTLAILVFLLPILLVGGLRFLPSHAAASRYLSRVLVFSRMPADEEMGEDASYDKQVERHKQVVLEMRDVITRQNITMTKTGERVEDNEVVFDMDVDFSDFFQSVGSGNVKGSYDAIQKLDAEIAKQEAASMRQAEENAKLVYGIANFQKLIMTSPNQSNSTAENIKRLYAKLDDEAQPNFDGQSCPVCGCPVDREELDNLGKCNICRGEDLTKTHPSAKNQLMPRVSHSPPATKQSSYGSSPSSSASSSREENAQIAKKEAEISKAKTSSTSGNLAEQNSNAPSPSSSASSSNPYSDGGTITNAEGSPPRDVKTAKTKKETPFPSRDDVGNGIEEDEDHLLERIKRLEGEVLPDDNDDDYDDENGKLWERVDSLMERLMELQSQVKNLKDIITENDDVFESLNKRLSSLEETRKQGREESRQPNVRRF